MYISPVNNTVQFKALRNVKLVGMADYPPRTNVNQILNQFKEDKTFKEFCDKFDVNLFIGTSRTGTPCHPFECSVSVDYTKPQESKGFFAYLKRIFTLPERLGHDYASPAQIDKWQAESDFVSRYEYHHLIEQMKEVLKEKNSIDECNNIIKAMIK